MSKAAVVLGFALLVAGCASSTNDGGGPSATSATSEAASETGSPASSSQTSSSTSTTVANEQNHWHLAEGGVWVVDGTPPPCPDPIVLQTPTDLANVTGILYPGQVRGNAFKPHGGFRLDDQPDNNVTVRIPFDALIVRGTHGLRNGTDIDSMQGLEEQDGFEAIAPCGIMYTFGHLRRLAPRFQDVIEDLPLVVGFNRTQYYDVDPPVPVHAGEVLATAVGFEEDHNVFFDFGALDLRHTNGKTLRPAWSQYADGWDKYAVCWLDWLSPAESATAHAIRAGSEEAGKESDYC